MALLIASVLSQFPSTETSQCNEAYALLKVSYPITKDKWENIDNEMILLRVRPSGNVGNSSVPNDRYVEPVVRGTNHTKT